MCSVHCVLKLVYSNLGSGSDITSVSLVGVTATIVSQTASQVVVTAGSISFNASGMAVRLVSTPQFASFRLL
jgi:hypothetical protein